MLQIFLRMDYYMWLGCLGISSNKSTEVLIFLLNLFEANFLYTKYPNSLFKISGMSGMVSVLIVLIVDSYSWKISKVLIGEYLCQGSQFKGVTMPHPYEETGNLDRDSLAHIHGPWSCFSRQVYGTKQHIPCYRKKEAVLSSSQRDTGREHKGGSPQGSNLRG